MKKLIYILAITMLYTGCSYKKAAESYTYYDSIFVDDLGHISIDSFLKIKDSLIYVDNDRCCSPYWCTKKQHWFNYECPDTITVAFTRDGKFECYEKAVRRGLVADSTGDYYSPAYVIESAVGDNFVYDINGKFIKFNCVDLPHSDAPHTYKP